MGIENESENKKMDKFEKELETLMNRRYPGYNYPREVVRSLQIDGRQFIETVSHGYLVVPKGSVGYSLAKGIVDYGYEGILAVYLEEDCEIPEFLALLTERVTIC